MRTGALTWQRGHGEIKEATFTDGSIEMVQNQESARLEKARTVKAPWRKWGPYLSERQWGTVHEDYSKDV
jgi:hypothetical protein